MNGAGLITPSGSLRGGYTTGACATACTRAALLAWITGLAPASVTIALPCGEAVDFPIVECELHRDKATCLVRKDAGDDPDVTHGALVGATVRWRAEPGVSFLKGEGVGLATLPGLPMPVGEPAINPVPRRMMTDVVRSTLAEQGLTGGATVEVFLRGGAELAQRTLNPRLGIVGGVSILGTTGRVRPFSSSAYIASIASAMDVAAATGCRHLVLSSGGRTEAMLKRQFPELPAQAFIHYGNWIGEALTLAATRPFASLTVALMLGKAVKLAAGKLDTHSREGTWDRGFIAGLAEARGHAAADVERIPHLLLARQLSEIFPFTQESGLYHEIAQRCQAICAQALSLPVEIRLHNDGGGWLCLNAQGFASVA